MAGWLDGLLAGGRAGGRVDWVVKRRAACPSQGMPSQQVMQVYLRYTEKGGQGGHQVENLPAGTAEVFVVQLAQRIICQVFPGCHKEEHK